MVQAESGFTSPSFWDSGPLKRQKQVITLLTADGFVTLPSWSEFEVPRRFRAEQAPLPTAEEQGLCLGACFTIAATNGADPSRRLNMLGFCRSVNDLSEVVEDAVLSRGGKIVVNQIELKSGLHEFLKMTVAIPLLNGIPPQHEYLRSAISSGGGIVERMYRQWQMYG
ncbi:g6255 [Coccomyxa viridis]|uniref:G6255 protein n=1 Tax=Coccomyxa viridis TaxID=1274662 RepID=A0ABP1FXF9_9CHLO